MTYNVKSMGNSTLNNLFSGFSKYIFTDKVEIKKVSQLPVFLLHKTY